MEFKVKKQNIFFIILFWKELCNWYSEFMISDRGKQWINWFNTNFPLHKDISDVKKIDFIIFATN